MAYESLGDLPDHVRERLTPEAQTLWMRVYNRSEADLGLESAEDVAYEAVRRAGHVVDIEKADPKVGAYVEAGIHRDFTYTADDLYGQGTITRDQRIVLSNAIGEALDRFRAVVEERAPELYTLRLHDDLHEAEVMKFDAVGKIEKRDDEKRLVFGYAMFSEDPENRGELYVDRQGDAITLDELERTAYDYVVAKRDAGAMHRGEGGMATLVESVVFTPEKLAAMGLPEDSVPEGAWWIGMKVSDDDTWERVKSEEYTAFSVDGSAIRKKVSA